MDEGRKRILWIMASMLVARQMKTTERGDSDFPIRHSFTAAVINSLCAEFR